MARVGSGESGASEESGSRIESVGKHEGVGSVEKNEGGGSVKKSKGGGSIKKSEGGGSVENNEGGDSVEKNEGGNEESGQGEEESEEYRAFLEPFLCKALLLLRLKPLVRPSSSPFSASPGPSPFSSSSGPSPFSSSSGPYPSLVGGGGSGGEGQEQFSIGAILKEVTGFLKNEGVDILSLVRVVKSRNEVVVSKVFFLFFSLSSFSLRPPSHPLQNRPKDFPSSANISNVKKHPKLANV